MLGNIFAAMLTLSANFFAGGSGQAAPKRSVGIGVRATTAVAELGGEAKEGATIGNIHAADSPVKPPLKGVANTDIDEVLGLIGGGGSKVQLGDSSAGAAKGGDGSFNAMLARQASQASQNGGMGR